jgi:DNA-binding response OmpR family regulator
MITQNDIETVLRRGSQIRYEDSHLEINLAEKIALLDSRQLKLTRKEYELLRMLVENAGDLVPREALLMRVWGYGSAIRTRTLDVHIRRLRKRLAPYSDRYIETIFGVGYRFQPFLPGRDFRLPNSLFVKLPSPREFGGHA